MNLHKLMGFWFVIACAIPISVWADEHGQGEALQHEHHLAIFLGNTHEHGRDEFTVGADYERRLTNSWGIGGLVDYAGGEFDTLVIGLPVFFHPQERWRFLIAPGVERHSGESEFLVRVGASFEFEVNRWSVSPTLSIDTIDGEFVQVFGFSIGRGF